MGTGVTSITMAQLPGVIGRYSNVQFFNDPSDTDLLKTVEGHPGLVLINLGQLLNISTGEIQGDAMAADEIQAAQIAANAVGTSELINANVTDAKLASSILKHPGALANGVLRASGNYSDGETITIGTDVFEIDPITTDSTDDTAGGLWNNTTDPLTVAMPAATYPVTGVGGTKPLIVNELVYIDTEYLRVTGISGNDVTFERGAMGSTAAGHADAVNIMVSAARPASNIPVGIQADVTAATVTPLLAACINENPGAAAQSDIVNATSLESGAVMLIVADSVGVTALATTETGANLAWDDTAMRYGAAAGVKQVFTQSIVPDSEEATAGNIYVPLPFDATFASVQVITTATGALKAWDGDIQVVAASAPTPAYLLLNNDGAVDWDANDTLRVIAIQ